MDERGAVDCIRVVSAGQSICISLRDGGCRSRKLGITGWNNIQNESFRFEDQEDSRAS